MAVCGSPELVQLTNETMAYVVTTEEQWESALGEFRGAMGPRNFIGLDVEYLCTSETQPRENRVAQLDVPHDFIRLKNIQQGRDPLLQLGTNGLAVLIRLCYFTKLPQSLSDFLEDKNIVKIGVEIQDDVQRLKVYWKLRVRSFVDLRFVCLGSQLFCDAFHFRTFSLKSIGSFLGQAIIEERDWRVAASNWAAPKLSHQQIEYAANDALAASGSYETLLVDFQPGTKCKYNPKEAAFWEHHWEKRFRRYVNRSFSDNTLSRYMKTDGDTNGGGQRALESRIHRSEMKPKQYKKMEEQMHNSDSELDCNFEQEKAKKMASLPQIIYLEFYPEDQKEEDKSPDTESQATTGHSSSGDTTAGSVCVSSVVGMSESALTTESTGGEEGGRGSLGTLSSVSSRSVSVSDSEALRSVSESRMAEKILSGNEFWQGSSVKTDATDMETEETGESRSSDKEEGTGKKTDKTETSEFSADGPFIPGSVSGSGTSSGFAADVSEFSEQSKSEVKKRGAEGSGRQSGTVETQKSVSQESKEADPEEKDEEEEEDDGTSSKDEKGRKKGVLKAPLLVEKELLDYCIRAKVPSQTFTMVSDITGVKRHFRVKIEDFQVLEEEEANESNEGAV